MKKKTFTFEVSLPLIKFDFLDHTHTHTRTHARTHIRTNFSFALIFYTKAPS